MLQALFSFFCFRKRTPDMYVRTEHTLFARINRTLSIVCARLELSECVFVFWADWKQNHVKCTCKYEKIMRTRVLESFHSNWNKCISISEENSIFLVLCSEKWWKQTRTIAQQRWTALRGWDTLFDEQWNAKRQRRPTNTKEKAARKHVEKLKQRSNSSEKLIFKEFLRAFFVAIFSLLHALFVCFPRRIKLLFRIYFYCRFAHNCGAKKTAKEKKSKRYE